MGASGGLSAGVTLGPDDRGSPGGGRGTSAGVTAGADASVGLGLHTREAWTVEDGRTEVALDFAVDLPFPPPLRQLIGFGMRRWVRGLHRRDLVQLKAHVETTDAGHIAGG